MPTVNVAGAEVEYAQSGTGPYLLLLHSLLTDATVFEPMLPMLESTHRVTRLNLPGFGGSSARALASVGDYADHVALAMDALALPKTTDVFGNGFGAFVALELAIRHGARLGNLYAADVVAAFPEPARAPFRAMAARVREAGMSAVLDTAIGRMFPEEFQARHPEVVAKRKSRLALADPGCFAQACLGLAGLDLTARLPSIRNRTLVMCGDLDRTTPPELAAKVAEAIPGAAYHGIAGSGHCPMLEQPGALVAAIASFESEGARA
ncbi:MAG TPA: alpha/beta fold hydrolase [Usitatibacter sp.]|nr:alpha/beta fold hydrolase [Usitatibacter sp.]